MRSFRKAFTMVELVFVIVVIGILAGIAVSTLSATRHDAKVSVGINNIKQAIVDIGSYCLAQDEFGTWQEMTDVPLDRKKKQKKSRYKTEGENCIVFIRTDNPDSITVKINNGGYKKSTLCKDISDELIKQRIAAKKKGVKHMFGGTSIN